ncbi:MAG: hypothetical protein B6U77_00905 [Candidatus Hecatellales archaeon ex4484_218]|nr:MAG: hypothetical protein B6U77_00905 [Candidatus Hecatellales archaeon ex4484_218]
MWRFNFLEVGLSTLYLTVKSFKKAIKTLTTYADECKTWEIVDEFNLRLNKLKVKILNEIKESFSLKYTVHTPFYDLNIASLNPTIRKTTLKIIEKSMRFAWELEAKMYVLHPGFYDVFQPKKTEKFNFQSLNKLITYAKNLGIPVSVENLPAGFQTLTKVEDFEKLFNQLEFLDFSLALDVGHAYTVNQLELFLEKFQDKIGHVHLHNNDGKSDSHNSLDEGGIDWMNVVKTLKNNGFNGCLIVESTSKPLESYLKLKKIFG